MNTNTGGKRTKRTIAVAAAAVVLVALVAAGIGLAVHQRTSARLADARGACAQASETLRVAQNEYNALHDGKAAEAVKITGKQVEDEATVTVLAAAYTEQTPDLAACNVQGVERLREATARIDRNAAWYDTHTADLAKAVDAVNESYDAKTLKDAREALSRQLKTAQEKYKGTDGKVKDDKTRKALKAMIDKAGKTKDGDDAKAMGEQTKQLKDLMGKVDASVKAKADADRKAAEEQARKEAEAQAAAQAQANAQTQQRYVAPQQSYTPTYTAPQQTYTAPQQSAPQPVTPSTPSTGSGGMIFNTAPVLGCDELGGCSGNYDGFNHNGF
jgi:hypothetical protein